jgi:hypothetical protein
MKVLTLTILSSVLLLVGCDESNPDGRVGVSGTITYQGKPLNFGRIVFTPTKGNSGLAAGGLVEKGQFQIDAEEGPTAGEYIINVTVGLPPSKDLTIRVDPAERSQLIQPAEQTFEFTRIIKSDGKNILELELPPSEADSSS